MRIIGFLLVVLVLAATLLGFITKAPGETVQHLLIGWAAFIGRSCSRLTLNWNGVATAGVCIALLLLGGHPFLAWLLASMQLSKPSDAISSADVPSSTSAVRSARWSLKRTAQLLAVFMLLFMAGTAFIGLVHQTAWLATAPVPLTRYRLDHRYFEYRGKPLPSIGLGFANFIDVYAQCPPNGNSPDLQQASHSWQTRIWPFLGGFLPINFRRDWDDPDNAHAFRRFVPEYLNPDIGVLRDGRGYAVSHYAGNSRLFAHRRTMTRESLTGRSANTILCGEVVSDFMPWGDPGNVRDPAGGINRSRNGFGSTDERGAHFLMLDGSVRFLSTNTAPEVLTALATPDGD